MLMKLIDCGWTRWILEVR